MFAHSKIVHTHPSTYNKKKSPILRTDFPFLMVNNLIRILNPAWKVGSHWRPSRRLQRQINAIFHWDTAVTRKVPLDCILMATSVYVESIDSSVLVYHRISKRIDWVNRWIDMVIWTKWLGKFVVLDDTVGVVAERSNCCAACSGFDPRTEQLFVWPTESCSRSGCLYTWV